MAAMKTIRILHSIVALLLIVLYTVAMGSLALLLSLFDRTGEYQHWCARTWCRMIAFTVGMRVSIDGIAQLPRHTPAVVLANHQSLLDIPVLFAFLPFQFRILAKKELFRIPFLGWFLWRAGHIPVDRGNRNATPDMIAAARKVLHARIPVVIFPEGTRNVQPARVKAFKSGGFRLAREAGVPIVPVTIHGTATFLPAHSMWLTPCPVHLTIHAPLDVTDLSIEEAMTQVASTMNERLAALAQSQPQPSLPPSGKRYPAHDLSD
ncbi:1-acyl-sn-glycerol-3-phosphate acyltransferase [Chloracidobacterium sp. S]|nr:lysophospholipid acyltransferase family protein [Chloracidobacterium aggregatum]QUV86803.1 1-acyl-sn-glycerol-3-phosphate acyltransferase [Chloracidobacterium sp. S]